MHVKVLSTLLLSVVCSLGYASPEAYAWLDKMNSSIRNLDYEGRFVYQTGNQLGSMYLVHRIKDGVELERLVALNGEPRQVIRGDEAVACLEPGKKDIHVAKGSIGRTLTPQNVLDHSLLNNQYKFRVGEQQRVAGRTARLIEIIPKDNLRFGYQLYLDQDSALPLRSVMLDTKGEQRSQLLFVDLKTGPHITPIEHDLSALELAQIDKQQLETQINSSQPVISAWRFANLPAGYTMLSYRHNSNDSRDHFVFSDGLATVSMYIESIEKEGLEGFSRMGAVQALGIHRHQHQITVVGEVPKPTLRLLAMSVIPAND